MARMGSQGFGFPIEVNMLSTTHVKTYTAIKAATG
jgi:hypothetical protein